MPTRPPIHRPVGWQSPAQRKADYDRWRGTSTERGYGADWRRVRAQVLMSEPLCRFCQAQGRLVAATDVDHIRSIAEAPELRLDPANLRPLCRPCHARRTALEQAFNRGEAGLAHPDWLRPAVIPTTIVCGAPASGKSLYVRQHAKPGDLIIDLDEIASEMAGSTLHTWDRARWLGPAVAGRNSLLSQIASERIGWPAAWLIVGEPEARWRQWWSDRLRPQRIVVMVTDMDTCIDRAKVDSERAPRCDETVVAIRKWFSAYQRRPGDFIVRDGDAE